MIFKKFPNWVIPPKKSVTEGSGQGNKKHGFDMQHRNAAQRREEKGRVWRAARMEAHGMLKIHRQVESLWFGFGLPASPELLPRVFFSRLKAFAGNLLCASPHPEMSSRIVWALTSEVRLVGGHPTKQKVTLWIPSQGTAWVAGPVPRWGAHERHLMGVSHVNVSPPPFSSL